MKKKTGLTQKPREMLVSAPAGKKKLEAPATRSRVHGSHPDHDQSIRTAFPCRPTLRLG